MPQNSVKNGVPSDVGFGDPNTKCWSSGVRTSLPGNPANSRIVDQERLPKTNDVRCS
jgi:hypothetical protein